MTGMSRFTGRAIDSRSAEHLEQSIGDILTTPERSRVMLRPYGSRLPDLVDQPDRVNHVANIGEGLCIIVDAVDKVLVHV